MKVLLSKVSLLGAAAMLTVSAANAQRHQRGLQNSKQVVLRVNQYKYDGAKFNLSRAFQRSLGYNQKLVSIRVVAQSTSYNSKVVLKSQGQRLDAVQLNSYGPKTLQVPRYANISNLKLVLRGSAYIQRIVGKIVTVHGGGQGQAQVFKSQVNIMTTRMGGVLPVKKLVKEQNNVQLNRKSIKAVVFKAKAMGNSGGYAMAQVLVDGYPVGAPVYLSNVMQRQVISLRNVHAKGASIKLKITGKAKIQMVGLKVK